MKETIAGDIRRIRSLMKVDGDHIIISKEDYCKVLKLFDDIEAKAKRIEVK